MPDEICTTPSYQKELPIYQIDGLEGACGEVNEACPLVNGTWLADGSMEVC